MSIQIVCTFPDRVEKFDVMWPMWSENDVVQFHTGLDGDGEPTYETYVCSKKSVMVSKKPDRLLHIDRVDYDFIEAL